MAQQTKRAGQQTKRSSSNARSKPRTSSNGRSTAKPKSKASGARSRSGSTSSRGKSATKSSTKRRSPSGGPSGSSSSRRSSPSAGKSTVEQARDTAVENAQTAGSAIAETAKRLKTPALAAGAGIAGIAGGLALSHRDRRTKVLGVRMPKVSGSGQTTRNITETAKHVGSFAEKAGELASEVRQTREAIDRNGQRRSPVEVVLQGLTSRKQH